MNAAIYARKSTSQDGIADDARSVTRQVEHARAFIKRKGWRVNEDAIFVDDGISGAEFARRPGFVRLMAALKPRPPFQVLVVSEESRIGRESIEMAFSLKQLDEAGVAVWCYLDDRQRTLSNATEKVMLQLAGYAAEVERERASQRMRDLMDRRARRGHVCGGAVFGYRNREVLDAAGRRSHVEREIEAGEADVIRTIFEMAAAGAGTKRIAKRLNAARVKAPRPQQGRPQSWVPSTVRAVLHRDLYRGIATYNRTAQTNAWGQRAMRVRPKSAWISVPAPQLRIIDDVLWQAAHRRLDAARAVYLGTTNGRTFGRPACGIESKHLLAGFLQCACCGQSLTARSSSSAGRRLYYFVCSTYDHRGKTECANGLRLPMTKADDAVLSTLAAYVLAPEVVEGAIADAVRTLRPSRAEADARTAALAGRLRQVEAEQAKLVAALTVAPNVELLAKELQAREDQRKRLVEDLRAIETVADGTFDARRIERELRARLVEWRRLLRRQTPIARQMLSLLLDGRIVWTPKPAEARYEFSGRARLDRLLAGAVVTRGVTSPAGFEPAFWP